MTEPFSAWPWLFVARHRRLVDFVAGGLLVVYLVYVLMLSKFFSVSVAPPWFRDLGIVWNLADRIIEQRSYVGGYFFPPPNAILVHLYGKLDRELAFRIFLLVQVLSLVLSLWIWCRLLEIARRPDRLIVVLVAVLASLRYVHFELNIHNLNLLTLVLVSAGVILRQRPLSSLSYGMALALKPYSSVLVLPWMAWRGHARWTIHASAWLLVLFVIVPVLWFGFAETVVLYREWVQSVAVGAGSAGAGPGGSLSMRAGIAALMHLPVGDARVVQINMVLLVAWFAAVAAFFIPTLLRRGPVPASVEAAELAALLLVALPVGEQQPARGVVLLVAMLVIAAVALAPATSRNARASLLAILAFVGMSTQLVPMGPLHFLLTLPVCMSAIAGLAIARRAAPSP